MKHKTNIVSDPGDEVEHIYYGRIVYSEKEYEILQAMCKRKQAEYQSIHDRTDNAKDRELWNTRLNEMKKLSGKLEAGKYNEPI